MCVLQVVKLRIVASDCGHPPLSTTLDLSLVVNQTLSADEDDVYSTYAEGPAAAADGRRRGTDRDVVLVGAACGSGLVMFSAVLTAIVFAVRSQHRRQHRRHDDHSCCCCCCCEADNQGPSRQRSLSSMMIYQICEK